MAATQSPDDNSSVEAGTAREALAVAPISAPVAVQTRDDLLAGQITDLRNQIASLMLTVQTTKQQEAQTAATQSAIADLRADLNVTKAMLTAPSPVYATAAGTPVRSEHAKGCECDCTASGCCSFEIRLAKVRAAKPQIEPADAGDIPGLINALEVQFYITVGGIGFLFPSIGTTMDLRADGAPGGPGPWVVIERVINRVSVPKGTTMTYDVDVEVREHDEGAERPLGLKDELGEGRGSITLDCCMANIYPPTPIDVPLIHGGEGGGMVQFAFYARRVCC